jgi:probable HAF family extracellular repeat protein
VIGNSYSDPGGTKDPRGFLWQKGKLTDLGALGGYPASQATAINEQGQVIVNSYSEPGGSENARAFLWQKGKLARLPLPVAQRPVRIRADESHAAAINDRGVIVGACGFPAKPYRFSHACLWANGAVTDLGALSLRLEDEVGAGATAINEHNQIVGISAEENALHVVLWTLKRG